MGDLAFTSGSFKLMVEFNKRLSTTQKITFFGELKTSIGWKIKQASDNLSTCQEWYVDGLLRKHIMSPCNGPLTPMSNDVDIRWAVEYEAVLERNDHSLYCEQVGELLCLTTCTCPDISYAVCAFAQSQHARTERRRRLNRRIFRYILDTKHFGQNIWRAKNSFKLQAYADVDWAEYGGTRQSTLDILITITDTSFSCKGSRQSIFTLQSVKSEYTAMSITVKEWT